MHAFWIGDRARLHALAPPWAALCDRARGCSPFARPEWLLPWLEIFGGGCRLRVLAVEDAGELVALLPATELAGPRGPALGLMGGDLGDHHDAPVDDAAGAAARLAVAAALADGAARGSWATVTFDRLREDGWLRTLAGALPGDWAGRHEAEDDPPCPTLVAPPDADDLADVLPDGFAYRVGRAMRKAERAGGLELRAAATGGEALSLFDALSAFHAARWRSRGQSGVLAHPDVQRFHQQVIPAMQRAGVLRLFGLTLGGGLAGVVYGLRAHGRFSFYLSGFDLARDEASPGTLAVAGAIQHELRAGVRVFDFLRGREPYKYRFGARDAACYTVRLEAPRVAHGVATPAAPHSAAGASSSSRV